VRACQELPGQRLFQYVEGDAVKPVTSTDVNDYLRAVTGGPFTAKDYRTWAATLAAALLLCACERPSSARACKKAINEVLALVAARLGHTVAICRKSYVHPQLFEDFTSGKLRTLATKIARHSHGEDIEIDALRAIEPAVARYLKAKR
jgi:DNA topoisomerase-1